VVRVLDDHGEVTLDALGHRIRVDYTPDGDHGREWLRGLLSDLADDGLVELDETEDEVVARLRTVGRE
jgi:A/G-specific adenine glycosylase